MDDHAQFGQLSGSAARDSRHYSQPQRSRVRQILRLRVLPVVLGVLPVQSGRPAPEPLFQRQERSKEQSQHETELGRGCHSTTTPETGRGTATCTTAAEGKNAEAVPTARRATAAARTKTPKGPAAEAETATDNARRPAETATATE